MNTLTPVRCRATEINAQRHAQASVAERSDWTPAGLAAGARSIPPRDTNDPKHWRKRAGAATEGHTLSHTAKPGGDHGFSAFPAIDL